ncbi:MAG: hypothetical protein IT469_01775 [Pseudomonadales bacterium]|nr:hypothetical protein [Pseudomonadales bacterium]
MSIRSMSIRSIVAAVALTALGPPAAEAQPAIVTWGTEPATHQCAMMPLARGLNPWTLEREYQIRVGDDPPLDPRGALGILAFRADAAARGCAVAPGMERYWEVTISAPPPIGSIRLANAVYTQAANGNIVINTSDRHVAICQQSGPFAGRYWSTAIVAWHAPDWSSGVLCLGCPGFADANLDGRLSVQDLFTYIEGYFQAAPRADTDRDGQITTADLHGFLHLFLTSA